MGKWVSLVGWLETGALGHPAWTQSRAIAPLHGKETIVVVGASGKDAPWTPPRGGVQGMPNQEETLGPTQDTLEGLQHAAGLGKPWDIPRRDGGSNRREL